jgi:hypothetical protein
MKINSLGMFGYSEVGKISAAGLARQMQTFKPGI